MSEINVQKGFQNQYDEMYDEVVRLVMRLDEIKKRARDLREAAEVLGIQEMEKKFFMMERISVTGAC